MVLGSKLRLRLKFSASGVEVEVEVFFWNRETLVPRQFHWSQTGILRLLEIFKKIILGKSSKNVTLRKNVSVVYVVLVKKFAQKIPTS